MKLIETYVAKIDMSHSLNDSFESSLIKGPEGYKLQLSIIGCKNYKTGEHEQHTMTINVADANSETVSKLIKFVQDFRQQIEMIVGCSIN